MSISGGMSALVRGRAEQSKYLSGGAGRVGVVRRGGTYFDTEVEIRRPWDQREKNWANQRVGKIQRVYRL